jgi:hypothetical protein
MKTEMNHFPEAVFFDCWDTLLVFQKKSPDWNTLPLKRHALKPDIRLTGPRSIAAARTFFMAITVPALFMRSMRCSI